MDEIEILIQEINDRIKRLSQLAGEDDAKKVKAYAMMLRAFRAKNRLTQDDLAKKLEVNKMTIIRWEGMKSMPSQPYLKLFREMGIITE